MPNNCINELIFCEGDAARQDDIRAALCGDGQEVDFGVLVPIPANVWRGNVGQKHEEAFKRTSWDWCSENWGTKWNAYSHMPIERAQDRIVFRFQTAWRPPYPWLAAVFNLLEISFDHNWLSEGEDLAVRGIFVRKPEAEQTWRFEPWTEKKVRFASDPLHRHLHKLMYGVEEFAPEEEG